MTKRELLESLNTMRSLMRDSVIGSQTGTLSVAGKVTCAADLSENDVSHLITALTRDIQDEERANGLTLVGCSADACRAG